LANALDLGFQLRKACGFDFRLSHDRPAWHHSAGDRRIVTGGPQRIAATRRRLDDGRFMSDPHDRQLPGTRAGGDPRLMADSLLAGQGQGRSPRQPVRTSSKDFPPRQVPPARRAASALVAEAPCSCSSASRVAGGGASSAAGDDPAPGSAAAGSGAASASTASPLQRLPRQRFVTRRRALPTFGGRNRRQRLRRGRLLAGCSWATSATASNRNRIHRDGARTVARARGLPGPFPRHDPGVWPAGTPRLAMAASGGRWTGDGNARGGRGPIMSDWLPRSIPAWPQAPITPPQRWRTERRWQAEQAYIRVGLRAVESEESSRPSWYRSLDTRWPWPVSRRGAGEERGPRSWRPTR